MDAEQLTTTVYSTSSSTMGKIKMCKIKQNFALEFSYQMEVGTKIYEAKIVNITIIQKYFKKM